MKSTFSTHSLVLRSAHPHTPDAKLGKPATSIVLNRLRRQPGVLDVTFDPDRSAARLMLDSTLISLGDVVRLIEDAGASVNAIERAGIAGPSA